MEEKSAEGEGDGYIIRRVFKYAKEIFKKLTIDMLTMILGIFVDFFFVAPHPPISRPSICSTSMNPPKPFPILRLPFLAIQEVFKSMDPFEIINFSMISKRTKAVAKYMTFFPKYSIQLYIHETLKIRFFSAKSVVSYWYVVTPDKKTDGKIEENEWSRSVFKYSKDPVDEWKQLCKYVLEIFKKETIDILTMTMDAFVDQNVSIIDFLRANVKSVDKCILFPSSEEKNVDEHFAYFLQNVTINVELFSLLYIKDKNFVGKIPKHLHHLNIKCSKWFGYERLLKIDCKHVVLSNNQISDKEWNCFFKKWMTMETNQNLEYLELRRKELDRFRDCVLYDIPYEVVDGGVKRTLITYRDEKTEISGGIDIKRIDGKTATFFVQYNVFSMCVH